MANTSREREFLCGKINEPAAATTRCNRENTNRETKPTIAPNRPLRNGKGVESWVNIIIAYQPFLIQSCGTNEFSLDHSSRE